ncbi:hypothetical protein [Collimonas arenae]|uniref:hypothetical protein n=1 Tax=Collimonas arenae TaxID=279058 RepID=UPI00056DC7CC|nr:hypothetical protein [Collimonas arenae]
MVKALSKNRLPAKIDNNKSFSENGISSFLGLLAKIFAATIIGGGILLYFLGYIYQSIYLDKFGVSSTDFPKGTYETQIYGAVTLWNFANTGINGINKYLGFLLAGVLAIILYIWGMQVTTRKLAKKSPSKIRNIPEWLLELFGSIFITGSLALTVPIILILIGIILGLPLYIAVSQGEIFAAKKRAIYAKGCEAGSTDSQCHEILKNGQKIATGFILDSSPTYIAIFDSQNQISRVIERKDTELIVHKIAKTVIPLKKSEENTLKK